MSDLWWKKPLRVIQTNLQVRDTPGMDPAKIAREIKEMNANVLVTNVGGIYAWYPSKMRYHHVNEYLPESFDLLKELIGECHKLGIRLVARYDFSKTDDVVFQEKPQWFTRDLNNQPTTTGGSRFGAWSQLLTTCINSGYRNEGVAVPVLKESLSTYDIDGVFFNAPHYNLCFCDACRKKYFDLYGEEHPDDPKLFRPDWTSICLRDNIERLNGTVKAHAPDMPLVLYYSLFRDNLYHRIETADMICTEPQDVLSRGWKNIPRFWAPALSTKMGHTVEDYPKPFGIIHSCPGMDWRHTGLPPAEYRFWMSQIPANGGQIWHSLTGYGDTITDKRIIREVGEVNRKIKKSHPYMQNARSDAQIVLLWNAKPSATGIAEALIDAQIQFDLLDTYQITEKALAGYELAILPEEYPMSDAIKLMLKNFVGNGGKLLAESGKSAEVRGMAELYGIQGDIFQSESLVASYLRFEGDKLTRGFEETPLIGHRAQVAYCAPSADAQVLATLVPPFAPLEAVGAPPERASMPTPKTDIPLAILTKIGKGETLLLPFQLSALIEEYKLGEHTALLRNAVDLMLGGKRRFLMEPVRGLQAMLYRDVKRLLVNLVNGIGQRPLSSTIPYHGASFTILLKDGESVKDVHAELEGADVAWSVDGNALTCTVGCLNVWELIVVELK